MRKRVRFVFAFVLLAIFGLITWQVLQHREPVYKGKNLREWLWEAAWLNGNDQNVEAVNAVRHFGTNGIPTFLEYLRKTDSPLGSKLITFWGSIIARVPRLPDRFRRPTWTHTAYHLNLAGATGFRILGADGVQAIPELSKIYDHRISYWSQMATMHALVDLGPTARGAIPTFLSAATTSDSVNVREVAVWGLTQTQVAPSMCVPGFTKSLNDTNRLVRKFAAEALGKFGTNSQAAASALVLSLTDSDVVVRAAATNALKQIAPEAAAQAGVK